tara:strand:+ start:1873 stop:2421 length:549 start_codon:yes stop_codon:yes gene_type:complete
MKYTRGPVSTDKMWNRPTVDAIRAWHTDMRLAIERSGFTAYLVGSSLTNINYTNDVDIVYVGAYKPELIEQLLITSVTTAFRHNILIDVRWQNVIETAEYKDDKITVLPTQFVFLNYYEYDYGNGHKVINDFRLNPNYKAVGENLVYSTFAHVGQRMKPHLREYMTKYGKFAHARLDEYNRK